jgi:hypothetical protein
MSQLLTTVIGALAGGAASAVVARYILAETLHANREERSDAEKAQRLAALNTLISELRTSSKAISNLQVGASWMPIQRWALDGFVPFLYTMSVQERNAIQGVEIAVARYNALAEYSNVRANRSIETYDRQLVQLAGEASGAIDSAIALVEIHQSHAPGTLNSGELK